MRCRLAVACALGVAVFAVSVPGRGLSSGSSEPHPTAARRPNVIIYLVDTLRADHLGVYGYDRDTSPVLDRWATGGVVFERAYAPCSWTKPSVATLFTGLYPES